MSDYLKISFCRYFISLLTGKALQLPSCLVIPGWRKDFIYSVGTNGQRRVQYVPSRFIKFISTVWKAVVTATQTVSRITDMVATIMASRTILGSILRWVLRAVMTWLLGHEELPF